MKRIVIGVLVTELLFYFIGAFIFANVGWLNDIFSWATATRFMFAYLFIAGGFFGGWIAKG